MTKETIFFLLSVSIVTLALSFFTAFVYTKAFPMSLALSRAIKIAGIVFPFLFVLANALSRFSNLEFVKWVYTAMSVGAGIAFYLMLGAIMLALALIVFKILGKDLPIFVPWVVLISAVAMSFIGLIQARDLKKVSYNVYIENLPLDWQDKKAILFSDTHYGLVNNKKAARRLADKIISEKPDVIFMAGDLFDGPDVDTLPLISIWSEMSVKFPVFYAPGNHEEYGNYIKFIEAVNLSGFIVLEDKAVVYNGVNILGFKYRGKNKEGEIGRAHV